MFEILQLCSMEGAEGAERKLRESEGERAKDEIRELELRLDERDAFIAALKVHQPPPASI